MRKKIAPYLKSTSALMIGFISLVIIAGFFGPYVISLILAGLSVLCLVAVA